MDNYSIFNKLVEVKYYSLASYIDNISLIISISWKSQT